MSETEYTKSFYEERRRGALRSAEAIVPLILNLLPIKSVVDVGCGEGDWLSVFQRFGVQDIVGIDGNHVDPKLMQIPKSCFRAFDLTGPFGLPRVFDLAISLEVAEHLPLECASIFVGCLARLAPVVLFSAAIPFQGGVHHVNEQWPDWWASIFREHGYVAVDCIRKRIWTDKQVDWWYTQNSLLFARSALLEESAVLRKEFEQTRLGQLNLVHPRKYLEAQATSSPQINGLRSALKLFLVLLRNSLGQRLLLPLRKAFFRSSPQNSQDAKLKR